MKNTTRTSVAAVMLILTALSSVASEIQPIPGLPVPGREPTLTAPTVVSKRVGLNSGELAKYQQLGVQSQQLANHQAAGASSTTKTVLIVVGVVVVVVVAAALAAGPGLPGAPLG